jgi:catechol 2,3-dioxygenase-like lactoylglutathione lyase family enzyme
MVATVTQHLGSVALVVRDYDEAIGYYCDVLGFQLREDTDQGDGKRWVVVTPPGATETSIVLARAAAPEQIERIGDQTGGRVFLLLKTDDFARDHAAYLDRGVRFIEQPRHESYGSVAVFEDLYGNRWDLLGPSPSPA